MAFLINKKTDAGTNIRYERIKPLKLGGSDGLIARHVKSLPADQTASWKLDAAGLLRLAGVAGENLGVLFDATGRDATAVCFYELTRLHGSCRDTSTNVALDFNVVLDQELDGFKTDFAAAFEAPLAAKPKKLGEILALTGGPCCGDWKWGQPGLQIGATVVQSHHTGTPCPNCTCGRKAAMHDDGNRRTVPDDHPGSLEAAPKFRRTPATRRQGRWLQPCGDEIAVFVSESPAGTIEQIRFTGQACAICMASTSLMTTQVKGKTIAGALGLKRTFIGFITQDATPTGGLGNLQALVGVKSFPQRLKCVTLGWHALEGALKNRAK